MTASPNLDLVRSIYAPWERGDYSSVEWAHPEIEFVIPDGPDPGNWTGLAEMADAHRNFMSAWESLRTEADEVREIDSDRVLVLAHNIGRGKRSGLDFGALSKNATLFHIRDGKVIRLLICFDRERLLADLGLAAEGDSPSA